MNIKWAYIIYTPYQERSAGGMLLLVRTKPGVPPNGASVLQILLATDSIWGVSEQSARDLLALDHVSLLSLHSSSIHVGFNASMLISPLIVMQKLM